MEEVKELEATEEETKKINLPHTIKLKCPALGASMPLMGAGVASLKFKNNFNAAMARVATMIPGQRKKLQEYKKDITNLAVTSDTSSTILADGMYSVISALGDTSNSMNVLKKFRKTIRSVQNGQKNRKPFCN